MSSPNRPPLSPAAQAVLDAYGHEVGGSAAITSYERRGIAAALRAAAEQGENLYDPHEGKVAVVRVEQLLAIASELEAHHG